jgi:polysaccharide export outer membrane protein
MNLRRNRTRLEGIILGTALILSMTGYPRLASTAEPAGKTALILTGGTPEEGPASGGKLTIAPIAATDQYTIGPEDVLQVSVWHEPEISGLVPVRPDGKISLPLIGDLSAAGLTPSKLQSTLTEKLSAFISNPEVAVTVQQIKSKNFNVLGEVQRPGSYPLTHSVSVLDAIGMAGGFRDFARVTKIYVLRQGPDGEATHLSFNYKQVIRGVQNEQNVELKPEDTVVVP